MEVNLSGRKSLFNRKGAETAVLPAAPNPELHRTLGLKEFLARLQGKGKVNLLDLGPALEPNILYLAARSCKIYVQDFFFELEEARTQPDLFSFPSFLDTAFPYPDATFDAVLAWDLFNYLGPKEGTALAKKLFAQMKAGGLLFALFSSAKTIPSTPLEYRIVDTMSLHYDPDRINHVNAPSFTNNEIARMMDRFAVVNFYFLRNGMREALLVKR